MVAVSLTTVEQRVRFLIANDAEELIPLESQPLFERFQRGEKSRSRELGGAGLGLAIVKELIVAHRGKVGYRFDDGKAAFWLERVHLRNQREYGITDDLDNAITRDYFRRSVRETAANNRTTKSRRTRADLHSRVPGLNL